MENPIFRKKSIDRVSSPEQLNDYIRVTNPGIWIVLAAVLILLAGLIVWAVVGKLETKVNAVVVSEEGKVICYVRESDVQKIMSGDPVRIGDGEYRVTTIAREPIAVGNQFTAYMLRVGGLTVGEWVYSVSLDAELAEGVYGGVIVTDSVSPISFLFN